MKIYNLKGGPIFGLDILATIVLSSSLSKSKKSTSFVIDNSLCFKIRKIFVKI